MDIVKWEPNTTDVSRHKMISIPGDHEGDVKEKYSDGAPLTAPEKGVLAAYDALESGRELIDLPLTLAVGGWTHWSVRISDKNTDFVKYSFPKLVVAPAASKSLEVDVTRHDISFTANSGSGLFSKPWKLSYPRWKDPAAENARENPAAFSRGTVKLPVVPQRVIPEGNKLKDFILLWEANVTDWKVKHGTKIVTTPRFDPALLQHIAGNLYAVVSVWDLTPIERSVLGG